MFFFLRTKSIKNTTHIIKLEIMAQFAMRFFSFTNLEAITRNCYWKYKLILIGNIFDRFKVFLFWAATSSCVQIVMFTDQYDWTRCKSSKMFLFRHMVKKLTKWS